MGASETQHELKSADDARPEAALIALRQVTTRSPQPPSSGALQQPVEHQERKSWRKNVTKSKSPTTSQPPAELASSANHHCVIELGSALNGQMRTSLVSNAATASTEAPHDNGSNMHRWSRASLAKHFKSSLHRLARRLSLLLARLESNSSEHLITPTGSRQLAATFSVYQASLAAESFKRAIALLLITAVIILLQLIQYNVIHLTLWLPGYFALVGVASYYYLILFKQSAEKRLADNNLLEDEPKHERRNPIHFEQGLSNGHILEALYILIVVGLACWIVAIIYFEPRVGPIMAIIIYIFYTQLAITGRRLVTLVCLISNLLVILPLFKLYNHQTSNHTAGKSTPEWDISYRILVSLVAFALFHLQGLYSNRALSKRCIQSFNDVTSHEKAKSERKAEGKKLIALLERAYPKDLVGEIRDHKLRALKLENQFQPFYFRSYESVSILYADIVNFTNISSRCSPQELVQVLHELVGRFDREADKYPCLRIKILGDCYYCVSGIPEKTDTKSHARDCVEMALDMIDILDDMADMAEMVTRFDLKMRVGIHSGRVICGVLGNNKKQFDVYSDDVRLANLLEQSGQPGRVHISERTLKGLDNEYQVEVAHDNLRSVYSHLREDVRTYFVTPPIDRPKLISTDANLKQHAGATSLRLEAARSRFRKAAIRVKTAQRFIRTIELPFSNLIEGSSSRSDSMSDTSSVMGSNSVNGSSAEVKPKAKVRVQEAELILTIESRFLSNQSSNLDPLTLRFKTGKNTYKTTYPVGELVSVLISSLIMLFLTVVYSDATMSLQSTLISSGEFIIVFLIACLVQWHQHEYLKRRDFLWAQEASTDREQLEEFQDCNRSIFYDLLPRHVATYYLDQQGHKSHKDLYCKSYTCTGVLFANIGNFYQFYDETLLDKGGLECLRVLNEIICDFDSLLNEEQFKPIDKIKTIGPIYMAAIGLLPDHKLPEYRIRRPSTIFVGPDSNTTPNTSPETSSVEIRRQVATAMRTLVMFNFKMRHRLNEIGRNTFFGFKLKSGINLGPVTAGVIAASKPHYDIWGNTVNVASRMESSAEPDKLQITEDVYELLEEFNHEPKFEFTCRGAQQIKGKGLMTTYYLELRSCP